MKILLIDTMTSFLDFAMRCEAEGHKVRLFLGPDAKGNAPTTGKGLVTIIPDWGSSMNWADLILTSDNAKYITALEPYRKRGFPLFAPNLHCTEWELERSTGQEVLESHGICCLPSMTFHNYDKAIEFVRANAGQRYVSKPTGDADKALSYVSKSSQDLLFMLEYWKRTQKTKAPFLLQEFMPGIEFAVGGWVGKNGFAKYFLENFEFKGLLNEEIGVNTGEMGTTMKYCTAEESKLAQEVLLPLEAELIRSGYTGFIDVSVIIDKRGNVWPLEFTTRLGWPLFQIQQVLHPDVVGWMKDLLEGWDTFTPSQEIAVGVVVALPDFPYSRTTKADLQGFPVWGITNKNRYWIHPCEMKSGEAPVLEGGVLTTSPMLVSAGEYLLVCSGRCDSVEGAKEAAYKVLKGLEIPNSPMYRTDIGDRLEEQLPQLQQLGFATTWKWEGGDES